VLIQPIMPSAAERLWSQLGIRQSLSEQRVPESVAWGRLEPGTGTTKGEPLFPRLDA
jgi:methionyl-tRNA synthetase